MRCRKIRNMIIDRPWGDDCGEDSVTVNRHLLECRECARFLEEHDRIRTLARECPPFALPGELDVRTRALCLVRLRDQDSEEAAGLSIGRQRREIKSGVLYAWIAALIGLTFAFMVLMLKDFKPDQPFTGPTVMVLILTIQNAVMLFFAPLVLYRHRNAVSKSSLVRETHRFA